MSSHDFVQREDVYIFPNPVSQKVNILYKDITLQNPIDLKLENPLGQIVYGAILNKSISESYELDLSMILNGFYILTFDSFNKRYQTKITINH